MDTQVEREVEEAARILLAAGATAVFVFGSAETGEAGPESDLDLAVIGLPPEEFFSAMGRVGFAISRDVDLVDLDEDNPFTEYLKAKGRLRRVA